MEISNFRVKMVTFLLRRWWLAKAFQEQTTVFHCVNVCIDWPLFALPTTITGVNVCVDWPLFSLPTTITGVNVCVDWPLFALPTAITGVNVCVDWPLFVLPTTITGVNVYVDWPLFALPTIITGVNVCVDWPLFALPTTITGVNVCVDWPLFVLPTFALIGLCSHFLHQLTNLWLSSAWNTESISPSEKVQIFEMPHCLLLSWDIEVNPGWENGLKKFDPTHVSNNQRSVGSTPLVNSNIPVRISQRRYSTHLYRNQHQSLISGLFRLYLLV